MEEGVRFLHPLFLLMKNFQCQRCGACCRQPGFVYLASGEAERLAGRFGMDVYDFTDAHCLLLERQYLVLKKQADETCLFLGEEGCSIYDARPAQCREFPLSWKTTRSLGYCEGLKED
jgi:uncharacterized protein